MKTSYKMTIAGLERELQLYPVSDTLSIAAFILFGDTEMTVACAKKLLERVPAHDVIMTAESKGIPLAYEMSRQSGVKYLVARKGVKVYMRDAVKASVKSITTANEQTLYLGSDEIDCIRGKRVLILDDVISTGKSLQAMEDLVTRVGGIVTGRAAVLAEGDAQERRDIVYLEKLPLFTSEGEPI